MFAFLPQMRLWDPVHSAPVPAREMMPHMRQFMQAFNGMHVHVLETPELRPLIGDDTVIEYDAALDLVTFSRKRYEMSPINVVKAAYFGVLPVFVALAGCMRAYFRWRKYSLLELFIGSFTDHNKVKVAKTAFEEVSLPPIQTPTGNHSHPHSQASRAVAKAAMQAITRRLGGEVYEYNMSASESASGSVRGAKHFFWAKDVTGVLKEDDVKPGDVIHLTDVDYYVDMPSFLASNPDNIKLLYTFTPEEAAASCKDYSFRLNDAGVVMNVLGGATYQHPVWNWDVDILLVNSGLTTVVYDVQKRRVSPHRSIVMLTPMRHFGGLFGLLANWLGGERLQRKKFVTNGFVRVNLATPEGRFSSIAALGSEHCVTIPRVELDRLIDIGKSSQKGKLSSYQVKSTKINETGAALLVNYVNSVPVHNLAESYTREFSGMRIIAYGSVESGTKTLVKPFAKPFYIAPAFVHLATKETEQASIQGRVVKPQIAAANAKPFRGFSHQVRTFFLKKLIPEPHQGVPTTFDDLFERTKTPKQRSDLYDCGLTDFDMDVISSFMKREPYGKVTDSRNISQFPAKKKYDWARYVYPMSDFLATKGFYAFGRTPSEIADKVASICMGAKKVTCPDISRMDGHVHDVSRSLEAEIIARFFDPSEVEGALACHRAGMFNKGYTSSGVKYDQGYSRASGGMETSVFNTVIEAELLFEAMARQWRADGMLGDCISDWQCLWEEFTIGAMAGGDDGLIRDVDMRHVEAAASVRGFTVTGEVFARGQAGVNFLSRFYGPNVWVGDPTSVCDIRRTMQKFHLTHDSPEEAEQKLFEKGFSLSLTDNNTPVVGPLVQRIVELGKGRVGGGEHMSYWAGYDSSVQWPNEYADWMEEFAEQAYDDSHRGALLAFVDKCTSLTQLCNCPYEPPEDVVVLPKVEIKEKKCAAKDGAARKGSPTPTPVAKAT